MPETTKSALDSIRHELEGELLAISIREGELTPEEEKHAISLELNTAIWKALYAIANRIDSGS